MLSSQVTCRRINTTHAVPLNSVVPYSVFDLHYSCYRRSQVLQSKTQLVEVVFPLFINDVFQREKTDTYFRWWSLKGVSLSRHKCTEHTSEIYLNFTLCKCLCSARLIRLYLAPSQKLPCFLCPIVWLMLSGQAALPPPWQAVMWVTCHHIQKKKAFLTVTGGRRSELPSFIMVPHTCSPAIVSICVCLLFVSSGLLELFLWKQPLALAENDTIWDEWELKQWSCSQKANQWA